MHLADAFIQSDLQLHSGYTFSLVCVFPGNRTHNLLRCWRNALPLYCPKPVGILLLFFLVLNTKLDILKKVCNQTVACPQTKKKKDYGSQWGPATVWLPTFFKIKLCSTEESNSFRFKTTWEWVNDNRFLFFGWTIHLMLIKQQNTKRKYHPLF